MYYFIVNPHSRSGHGMDVWKKAEDILKQKGTEYKAFFTEYTGHARELAKEIAAKTEPCTLGVLGGDGTLNEVVNGLAEHDFSHITLGYIPTGSGNDFARGLGLSTEVSDCVHAILSPTQYADVDIGLAKTRDLSRYFLVSSGIGYDADICRRVMVSPLKKVLNRLHLGKLTYVLVALKALVQYRPCPVSVRLDRQKILRFPRFFFIAGMNMKYEGGGVKFCPDADFRDRTLNLCLVGKLSKLKILALFPTAFIGKHTLFQGVHMMSCGTIDIQSKQALPVHCDGESFSTTDQLTLRISGKQIRVILR